MIRIDFQGKLQDRHLTETAFLKTYWQTVNYQRNTFTLTYAGNELTLNGDLDDVMKPLRNLGSGDPLRDSLAIIDEALADGTQATLAQRLLLACPRQIADLATNASLHRLVMTALKPAKKGDTETYPVKDALSKIFAYGNKSYSKKIAECFMLLDWRVCIYCGRNHLSQIRYETEEGKQEIKRGYQLDHFHDKSAHPYLALTLRNLIPACSFCNAVLKGTQSIGTLSPWSPDYNFHRDVKFRLANDPALMTPEKDDEVLPYSPTTGPAPITPVKDGDDQTFPLDDKQALTPFEKNHEDQAAPQAADPTLITPANADGDQPFPPDDEPALTPREKDDADQADHPAVDPTLITPAKAVDPPAFSPADDPAFIKPDNPNDAQTQAQGEAAQKTELPQKAKLLLERRAGNPYEDLIRVLRLEASYQLHAEAVLAVAKKRARYPDEHIRELAEITGLDPQTMKRHLFEPRWHESTSDHHPLSKLSRDIHTRLKIPPGKAE